MTEYLTSYIHLQNNRLLDNIYKKKDVGLLQVKQFSIERQGYKQLQVNVRPTFHTLYGI